VNSGTIQPYNHTRPPLTGGARFIRGFKRIGLAVGALILLGGLITSAFIAIDAQNSGEAVGRAVQAMQSQRTTVRNPEPNSAVNPPLSVAFRTDTDGIAQVRLLDARTSTELTLWTERVDPNEDWQANANFTRDAKPFPGYLVLTVQDGDGQFTSVVVMPLTIGAT